MATRKPGAARLIYAASETDADMLYATRFFAPDPFLFVQARGQRLVVMSDLEMDRARQQARVDRVLSWTRLADEVKRAGAAATVAAVAAHVLRGLRVKAAEVPRAFPVGLFTELQARRIRLRPRPDPFWPQR